MLSIALVSPYDFAVPGGVNEHIRHLARHLRGRGHAVEIIAPLAAGGQAEEGFTPLDSSVIGIPFNGSVARISLSPGVWGEVRARLQARDYDIVHVHEPSAPAVGPAVLYHSRAVTIATFHQYRESAAADELTRAIGGPLAERLHGRIAVSRAAREYANALFPGDYRIIPNGIEVADFERPDLAPLPELDDGKLNVLFVGRLEKRKGFRYLLRAFRIVKQVVPEARLLVAGAFTREDRTPFVHYVRHFRMHDVRFLGFVPEEQKIRLYKSAQLFCAPSTGGESFGIVLLEAMAAGAPVVASDIAGYRDVVQDGVTGLLVEPENEEALAAAIARLLRSPARRAALTAGARAALPRYDWSVISREVEAFYHEKLAEPARR